MSFSSSPSKIPYRQDRRSNEPSNKSYLERRQKSRYPGEACKDNHSDSNNFLSHQCTLVSVEKPRYVKEADLQLGGYRRWQIGFFQEEALYTAVQKFDMANKSWKTSIQSQIS